MRISWNSTDPGYRADCYEFDVLFNGGETPPKCWLADEELGEIHCCALNDKGRPFTDPDDPTRVKSVVHKGVVKIIRKASG